MQIVGPFCPWKTVILYGFSNAREETRAREQLLPREKVSGKARTRLGPAQRTSGRRSEWHTAKLLLSVVYIKRGCQGCQGFKSANLGGGVSPCTHQRPPGKGSFNVGLSDLVFKALSLTSFQRSRSPESLAGREYLILPPSCLQAIAHV